MWPNRACFGVPGQVMLALVFTQSLSISTKSRPQLHRLYASKAAVRSLRNLLCQNPLGFRFLHHTSIGMRAALARGLRQDILQFRLRLWFCTLLSGPALPGLHSST